MRTEYVVQPKAGNLTEERFWQLWDSAETPVEHYMLFRNFDDVLSEQISEEAGKHDSSSRIARASADDRYREFALCVAEAYDRFILVSMPSGDLGACADVRDTALMYAMQRCLHGASDRPTFHRKLTADAVRILNILGRGTVYHTESFVHGPLNRFGSDPYRKALHDFLGAILANGVGCDTFMPDPLFPEGFGLAFVQAGYFKGMGERLAEDNILSRRRFWELLKGARELRAMEARNASVVDILNHRPRCLKLKAVLELLLPAAVRWGMSLDEELNRLDEPV